MSVIGVGRAAKEIDRAAARSRGDRDAIRARSRDRASHDSDVMSGLSTCVVCGDEMPAADLLWTDEGQACPGCLPEAPLRSKIPWSLYFMPAIPLCGAYLLSHLLVRANIGVWTVAAFVICLVLLGMVSGAAEMRRTRPLAYRLAGFWSLFLCGGAGLSIAWSFVRAYVG